jgi:hypothetical protein
MPLELRDRTATIVGALSVEEVEPFVRWLRATGQPRLNLRRCTHLHTGAVQAMLLFHPKVTSPPTDPFLTRHVLPLLADQRPDPMSPGDQRPDPMSPGDQRPDRSDTATGSEAT